MNTTLSLYFNPERPKWHKIQIIMDHLGYKYADTEDEADLIFYFDHFAYERRYTNNFKKPVINGQLLSTDKLSVDRIFTEVFGYSTQVDEDWQGKIISKGLGQGTHDGRIVKSIGSSKDYIYQKYLHTDGAPYVDYRFAISDFKPILCFLKKKSEPFSSGSDLGATVHTPSQFINYKQFNSIIEFCTNFGLEFGEIDCLIYDNKLYIVDVNNTPSRGGMFDTMEGSQVKEIIEIMSDKFKELCLKKLSL